MAAPSATEQEMLELANRLRADPASEFDRFAASSEIADILRYFGVDMVMLQAELLSALAAPPLAWSMSLHAAADAHSRQLIEADEQSHQVPGEPWLGDRVADAGFTNFLAIGENVYAFATSAFMGHAGFVVDWGPGPGGMQPGRGHRRNLLDPVFKEIGIGIVGDDDAATRVGPLVVTQDFGTRLGYTPQIVGVVFDDRDDDGFYDGGEGMANVNIVAEGLTGQFSTTSWASGGYQIEAPQGHYTLTFSGGGLTSPRVLLGALGTSNVKIDLVIDADAQPTDNADTLTGSAGADVMGALGGNDLILGLDGADSLDGGADTDTLVGGAGGDSLDGGPGADSMRGGAGNDSYIVDDPGDRIAETRTGGADTVHSSITWTLGAHLEDLVLTGDAAIDGTGNNLNNVITGNGAANTLLGGGRADTLIGGGGSDLYLIDATDVLIEQAGGGNDTVVANATFALPDHIEVLRFNGTANVRGDGNAENNFILGNVGNNRLLGYDGNDTLNGGLGNDTLQGGEGADSLVGGEGVDRLDGGAGNDTYLLVDADQVIELANAGIDTVLSNISYTLPNAVENLSLLGTAGIAGTGNAQDNVLTGNGGANFLRGLGGADSIGGGQAGDTLEGGAGADTLTGSGGFDHFLWLSPAEGGDTVVDFRPGDDKLAFAAAGFGGLEVGPLNAANFALNAPSAAVPQFVYREAQGVLEWDATGTGIGPAVIVVIATLANKPKLSATDFEIVA